MSQASDAINNAKQEALFKAIEAGMPNERRRAVLMAKARRIHYLASIEQGFDPHQALALCMKQVL